MADEEQLPEVTITVKGPSEVKLSLTLSPSILVSELKEKIKAQTDIEVERQRLIYSGKVLKDEEPLSLYKVQNGHSIHLVKGAAKGGAATSSTSTSAPAANATAAQAASERAGVPSNLNAGMQYANNPLAALEGVQGHGFGGGTFNPFAQMPGGMGAGNLNDPNAMAEMMNNPEVISQAMSMMTPEMIDQIIAANPQLSAMGPQVRQMMQSPMMRQMLSNPEMIRQMMQMQGGMGRGGFGGGAGGAAPNPFANLAQGPESPMTANRAAGSPPAAGQAAPNPMAGLFGAGAGGAGGAGGGAGNPFGFDPSMMQQMQQMFGGGGGGGGMGGFGGFGGGAAPAAPQDTRPAEERFQEQLRQLNEMGLVNPQQNIRALTMTGGNVQAAIELIFSGSVPS